MSPLQNALPQQVPFNQPTSASSTAPPPRPQYLIIGLFALRLTQHLIMYLNPYAGSDTALRWLDAVLRSYDTRYALAKLKDRRSIEDYVRVYPGIVRSMIRQPKYRSVFMGMNPNQNVEGRELSDEELQAMIDFADAAGEWGSVVSLPSKYAQRMEQLANARSMAE
ncbi:hypothetical protein P171DRAFT_347218 [Karstenula rhodostoma CBS 690.94]|uniref:Uncharacterized protein n=1 Tax=Karstenula rhodostoma CBS 690.94 TaxID=1392251 RepID=A0A9P4UJI2_9PLEO|nr:hypothetical protein P171DRAFT_347218 [Karstenula rhodostoma CBS 690.94]